MQFLIDAGFKCPTPIQAECKLGCVPFVADALHGSHVRLTLGQYSWRARTSAGLRMQWHSWFTVLVSGGRGNQSVGAGCYRRGQDRERQDSRIPSARIHQGLLKTRAPRVHNPDKFWILFVAGEKERRQELRPQQGSRHADHGTNTRTVPTAAWKFNITYVSLAVHLRKTAPLADEDLRRV